MTDITDAAKRLLLGKPMSSERLGHTLLPKRLALPIFASDALSSVAYAPDEILLTLALAGVAGTIWTPWVGLAVVLVLVVVVASYRQNVHAYPSGGGDYEVVTENLGKNAGLAVASALLVDYVLTVAVSISSASQYVASVFPALRGSEVIVAISVVVFLTVMNLRGVKESGKAFAIPVYMFMGAIGLMAMFGFFQYLTGSLGEAESAGFVLTTSEAYDQGLVGLGGVLLFARAFASGCAALTGVEAISNGVPSFKRPKSRNAATTLLMLGTISASMLTVILLLAMETGVKYAENPAEQLRTVSGGAIPDDYVQHPVISQLADVIFSGAPWLFMLVSAVTGLILMLAANTAFNGFPILGSILARDGYLPRQMHTRGDRLAFSNGIMTLATGAIVLIWVFDAQVTKLIQLYIVGVFISFTLSQLGMVRHWTGKLRKASDPRERSSMRRSRVINVIGFLLTGTVLIVVLITKFTHGAWITLLIMALLFLLMGSIRKHYDSVIEELALGDDLAAARALPSRVHAIVLVSRIHKPTMRAVSYARATRPSVLEAVTVGVDEDEIAALQAEWQKMDVPVPLRVLNSPFREITRPVLSYVRSVRRQSPRDLVVVYVPEYVVGHWWEQLLHNQSAMRLKSRLLFTPGVVVSSVPWQLSSSQGHGVETTYFPQSGQPPAMEDRKR
ncbi:APC family permease [Timonella senegalensis]|uniref:APC family permease n=1 Tax=Timonella senegalensis TaxID=1465825 RepID=UPI0028B09E30|nr:APC family permease [Timonella senegalensis]